jgi:hypothetical protein
LSSLWIVQPPWYSCPRDTKQDVTFPTMNSCSSSPSVVVAMSSAFFVPVVCKDPP